MKSLSHVRLFATAWTAAYQAPPSMGVSRQEYWRGLPLPSPGIAQPLWNWELTVWQLESTSYSPDASNPLCFRQSSCEVSSRGYYRLNVCISPKLECWNYVPQCDGIRRWGLWELIRVRWGHEGGAPMNGISALLRVTRELHLSALHPVRIQEVSNPQPRKRVSLGLSLVGTLISDFQPPEWWEISDCCL